VKERHGTTVIKRKGVISLKCPFLIESESRESTAECHATERSFEPSSFELEEYCITERHRRCPLYDQIGGKERTAYSLVEIRGEVKRAIG
jgi:hypothetical protein